MFQKSVNLDGRVSRFSLNVCLSNLSKRDFRIRPQESSPLSQEKGGGASRLSVLQQNVYNSAFFAGTTVHKVQVEN